MMNSSRSVTAPQPAGFEELAYDNVVLNEFYRHNNRVAGPSSFNWILNEYVNDKLGSHICGPCKPQAPRHRRASRARGRDDRRTRRAAWNISARDFEASASAGESFADHQRPAWQAPQVPARPRRARECSGVDRFPPDLLERNLQSDNRQANQATPEATKIEKSKASSLSMTALFVVAGPEKKRLVWTKMAPTRSSGPNCVPRCKRTRCPARRRAGRSAKLCVPSLYRRKVSDPEDRRGGI
jgi:hypothetical protein